jgi:replication initiation protein RepC
MGSWSAQAAAEGEPGAQAAAPGGAGGTCREEGKAATGRERPGATRTAGRERPDPDGRRDEEQGHDGTGASDAAAETPPSRLPPALLRRLTPRALRDLGSEELRLYADHLEPPGRGITLRAVERAALLRRRELGITPEAWEEAERSLGWIDALVALVVIDRNRDHPTAPVRNPGGLLRDLARRRRAGTLDLAASVMGVWRREQEAGSVASDRTSEAP